MDEAINTGMVHTPLRIFRNMVNFPIAIQEIKMPSVFKRLPLMIFALLFFSLAGCGGGSDGGSKTDGGDAATDNQGGPGVSGVAAAGCPLVGYVSLKDSLGATVGPFAIGEDGEFSFSEEQIKGLTPPFFLEAKGRAGAEGCALYSWAGGLGTANINPLTSLAMGMAAGTDPATAFSNAALNAASLQTAVRQIHACLKNLLALYNAENQDFFSGAYTADHTGLDAMFDVVRITVTRSARAIITDKTANATLMNAALGDVAGKFLSAGDVAGLAGSEADMRGIAELFDRFAAAMNRVPTDNWALNLMMNAVFFFNGTIADHSPFGVQNGYVRYDYLTFLINYAGHMTSSGLTIRQIPFTIMGKNPNGSYDVSSTWMFSDGTTSLNGIGLSQVPDRVIKVGDGFMFTGNNSYATTICVQEGADKIYRADGTIDYWTFMILNVINYGTQDIGHIVATAPGIPDEITMTKSADNPALFRCGYKVEDEDVDIINGIINNTGKIDFMFRLYTAAGVLLQNTRLTMYAAPPPTDTDEDRQALEPSFIKIVTTGQSHSIDKVISKLFTGGIYSFVYTLPSVAISPIIAAGSALTVSDLGSNSATFKGFLLTYSPCTSDGGHIGLDALNFTPATATLTVYATDIYGREFYVDWKYQ